MLSSAPQRSRWRQTSLGVEQGTNCRKRICSLSIRGKKPSSGGTGTPGSQRSIQPWKYSKLGWIEPRTSQSTLKISSALRKRLNFMIFRDHLDFVTWLRCFGPLMEGWPQYFLCAACKWRWRKQTPSFRTNKMVFSESPSGLYIFSLLSLSPPSPSLMTTVRKLVCLSTSRRFLWAGGRRDEIPMDYSNSLSLSSRKKCYCNKDLFMCPLAKTHKVTEWSKPVTEGQKLCILLLLFPCLQMSQQRRPIIFMWNQWQSPNRQKKISQNNMRH